MDLGMDYSKSLVFLLCGALGALLGLMLPPGPMAAYGSVLGSYHLFLIFLVFTTETRPDFSLPIGRSILTHAAFTILVSSFAYGRDFIPYFPYVRFFVPILAAVETNRLFSAAKKSRYAPAFDNIVEGADLDKSLGARKAKDQDELLVPMADGSRPIQETGIRVEDTHAVWLDMGPS